MPRPDSDGARRAEHRDDEPPERHQDGSGKGHDPTVGTNDSENDIFEPYAAPFPGGQGSSYRSAGWLPTRSPRRAARPAAR